MSGTNQNDAGKGEHSQLNHSHANANDLSSNDNAPEEAQIDVICNMKVLPSRSLSYEFQGRKFYFCSKSCHLKFSNNPLAYIETEVKILRKEAPAPKAVEIKETELKAFYLAQNAFDFTCPMHPEITQKHGGSCPKCGMPLEASLQISGDNEEDAELNALKIRMKPAAVLTIILLAVSMPSMLGLSSKLIPNHIIPYLELALSLPVVLWCGQPIFSKAINSARQGHLNMFSLIALGVSISFLVSIVFLFVPVAQLSKSLHSHEMLYFESACSVITLVLLGQILELKARESSNKSLQNIFALAPSKARREGSNGIIEIAIFDVMPGETLKVLPGDKIPVDGLVISGTSSTDESLLSGNSLPVPKREGERVYAGTINGGGSLLVKTESVGRDTTFAKIVDLLASAQRSRSPMQETADKASSVFIPTVLAIALLTFAAWFILGGSNGLPHAIKDSVAVLVIACPCALGLATPLAVSIAVAKAAELGLMVKDARALEMLAVASNCLIDKTGTLTQGKFEVIKIATVEGVSEDVALSWAASLEQESSHPLAASICEAAKAKGLRLSKAQEILSTPGRGIKGKVDGRSVAVGSARFMEEEGLAAEQLKKLKQDSGSSVFLCVDSSLKALFHLEDKLKNEAGEFVSELKTLGLRPNIMSGDSKMSVASAAHALHIPDDNLRWDLHPQDKADFIKHLQSKGNKVAMIGDGVNDAGALTVADVGIAMASGSDVALASAAITVTHSDLLAVTRGIRLARLMTATMKENLLLAVIYNIGALFLATGMLYPSLGIELSPSIAAAAMSLSSLSVILNSMKIRVAKFS